MNNTASTLCEAKKMADRFAVEYASSAPWIVITFRGEYLVVMSTYLKRRPEAKVYYRTGE